MSLIDAVRYRLRVWFNPTQFDRDIDEERAFHLSLDAMQREHSAHGALTGAEAQDAAHKRFGNTTMLKEDARTNAGLNFFDLIQQDLKFAIRSFARTPAFTIVAALTLAIGIGANTAIFSAIDALLMRPLPFVEPERLMKVSLTRPAAGESPAMPDMVWSYPKFVVLRDHQTVFSSVALYTREEFTVRTDGDAERVPAEIADGAYFRILGIQPVLGRNFLAEEDSVVGGPKVVTISHAYWTRRFNADPKTIGSNINIGNQRYQVVGVWPEHFRGVTGKADIWMPVLQYNPDAAQEPFGHQFDQIARLKAGVSPAQAKAAVLLLGAMIDKQYPNENFTKEKPGAVARELNAVRVDPVVRKSLFILLGAVALVLLIVCANVANLFLVRSAARSREIAVRLAIGASRARLVRQLVTESLLLSAVGGAVGVAIAWGGVKALSSLDAARALNVRRLGGIGAVDFSNIELSIPALLVAAALAVVTGVVFGLVPAWQTTRRSMADELKSGKARVKRTVFELIDSRSALASMEIALALVLLVGSGLMLRSLGNLLSVAPGFAPQGLLSMRFNAREGTPRDSATTFYTQVVERVAALPGVSAVTLQDCSPLSGGCNGTAAIRRDRPESDVTARADVGVHWVGPNWASVMGVPVKKGRAFDSGDRSGRQKVVMVSETAARRLWPNEDPIGKPVSVFQGGFDTDTAFVVGVVGDLQYGTVDSLSHPDVYLSYLQSARGRMMLMVRTAGDPLAIAPSVRSALREIAPELPVYDMRTMESRISDSTAYARFATMLLSLFGALALLLAALGTYGVIAFSVSQRTREIGIRVALGASASQVVRMIVSHGLGIAAIGGAVGIVAAFATTRVLQSLLFDVKPTDPSTFGAIVIVLVLSVTAASWIPARRAAKIQPTEALRQE